jgi:hypothetical protein
MADVPLLVISEYAASERRITPSWTIFQLKSKLEPVTGIPPSCQKLSLKQSSGAEKIPVEAADEDAVRLSSFPLAPYAELHVSQPFSISLAAERFFWPGMRRFDFMPCWAARFVAGFVSSLRFCFLLLLSLCFISPSLLSTHTWGGRREGEGEGLLCNQLSA